MSTYTTEQLVSILSKASYAYYNGGLSALSDEAYDTLRDELEMRDPSNPFLRTIGAPVEKGAVRLPYKMPSLTKIKPGGAVEQFAASCKSGAWVLSDKLDGISVLWVAEKKQLFLRGDGLMGVNVSQYVPYIQGLCSSPDGKPLVVRGELIVREGDLAPGTLGRSWVNGLVHNKIVRKDDAVKLRFVAYQMLVPTGITRIEQMNQLKRLGFEVPYYCLTDMITDEFLGQLLQERRAKSPYAIDGIVVGEDSVPLPEAAGDDVTNPKDMRAFKMPLGDQQATTRVVDVIWSASYQGYWIPRIQIEPVQIGGSRIEFLTGHNARFVLDNKISKGAVIVVRKSGDVIPTLDHLVTPGPVPPTVPNGVWDGPTNTAKHLKVAAMNEHDDVIQKRLEHFAAALEVPYLGPGLVAKLIAAGIKTPGALLRISQMEMSNAIGSGMADKIYPALQSAFMNVSEMNLMIASGTMPRGVGDKKLRGLFALSADPRRWSSITECEGWSKAALKEFMGVLTTYETWRQREFPSLIYPIVKAAAIAATSTVPMLSGKKEIICFSGFRSADMEKKLLAKGHEMSDSVTKKTTILVVPDTTAIEKATGKVKKAQEMGSVKILTAEQITKEYL